MSLKAEGTVGSVLVFDTPEKVALAAAERFVAYAQEAIADHGVFSVALAGGNTPSRVYELLASDPFKNLIEWSNVHLFFGDERCVPPHHPDSNYGMVYTALVSRIEIPSPNVHRIVGEGNPEENAAGYEKGLGTFFGELSWPRFDLVLLGMGEDGHTASLFPGSDAVKEESKWVVATRMEQLKQDRITLTAPVFNHAAHVMFLVTGKGKAKRLAEAFRHRPAADRLPAQLIRPVDGTLEWLVDKAVAAFL
jgi:6-phosphogluconolactonase